MHSLGVCRIHTTAAISFFVSPGFPLKFNSDINSSRATRGKITHSTTRNMLFFSHFAHDGADGNSRNNDDRSDHSPAWRIDLRNLPFFPFSLLCMATMESATGGQWREWRLIGDQPISLSFLVFFFFFSPCAYVLSLCLGRWIIFLNMSFLLLFCDFRDAIPPIL